MAAFTAVRTGLRSDPLTWGYGTAAATQPGDNSFELPAIANNSFQQNPGGGTWTFNAKSGVVNPPSGFGSPAAVNGSQTALLQNQGGTAAQISQTFSWTAGTYYFSVWAARRGTQVNPVDIRLDGVTLATVTPTSGSFAQYVFGPFTVSGGSHTLLLIGTASTASDNTTFLDLFQILDPPTTTPQPGDTITVPAGLTVTDDVGGPIGTSPSDNTTIVLDVTGTYNVQSGATAFQLRGNCQLRTPGQLVIGTSSAGAIFEFDASQASVTTTNYRVICGAANGQTACKVTVRGAAGNRSVIRSNAGGGNGAFAAPFNDTGQYDFDQFTLQRLGGSGTAALQVAIPGGGSALINLTNGTVDSCGLAPNFGSTAGGSTSGNIQNVTYTNSLATNPMNFKFGGAVGGATRTIKGCYFDKQITLTFRDTTLEDCVFADSFATADSGFTFASFKRNFVRLTAAGAGSISALTHGGDAQTVYLLADNQNGNPHVFSPQANCTLDGLVFEYTGPQVNDGGDGIYFATALTITVKNCLVLPSSGDGNLSCNLINAGSGAVLTVLHNTFFAGYQGGLCVGDISQSAGIYAAYKSNLAWVGNGYSNGAQGPLHIYSAHNSGNPPGGDTQDVLTPAGVSKNAGWNLLTGYSRSTQFPGVSGKGYQCNTSAAVGTDDVDLGAGGTGPDFVDSSRNFQNWAVHKGVASSGDSQATKIAAGLALLSTDPTLVSTDLVPWVRGGFAPRNTALRNAGHDGVTIGAVEMAAGGLLLAKRRKAVAA